MMKRTLFGLATAAALAAGSADAQTLRIGLWDNPDTIDPTLGRVYSGRLVLNMICDKLFDITPDLKIVPKLAISYDLSEDGKTMTMKLRENVKFQDGEPFNAEAVKISMERHLKMPGSLRKTEIDVIDSIDVVDPMTVRLNLKQPSAPLLSYFTDRAGMILSPKAVAALGENFGKAPVCNGPFKLVERGAQDRIVLERFDGYWDKANIHFDSVIMTPIPDGTVRVANLRAGQLDMIERVSPQDLTTLRGDSKIGITAAPELGYQMITFNVDNGPKSKTPLGQDARLREAFNAAIDRKVIAKVVFNDEFIPGSQYISPKNFFFDPAFPVPPRDVARAKALMKEAGHPTYSFTLITANDPDWIQAAQIIQSMVAEVGFDMKIEVLENATRSKRQQDGDFEAGFSFWSGRVDPDGNIGNRATCGGANNDAHYCNPEVKAWIDEARKLSDPEARKKVYAKVTAQLAKDRPLLFIWHRNVITAFNKKLQGFEQYSDGLIRLTGVKFDSKS